MDKVKWEKKRTGRRGGTTDAILLVIDFQKGKAIEMIYELN